jgi:anaerobic C4-dicarboxylate transporter
MKEPSFDEEIETPNLDFYDNEPDEDEKKEGVVVTALIFLFAILLVVFLAFVSHGFVSLYP